MYFEKFYCHFLFIIILKAYFAGGIGITFKEDVTLSLEQKGALDKVNWQKLLFKTRNTVLYNEYLIVLQFKERVLTKLPEAYMKTEINLIKWLRCGY